MTFLHNNCIFDIFSLKYLNNKSSFEKTGSFSGKIKSVSLQDNSFNLSDIKGEVYKITLYGDLELLGNERIEVLEGKFIGKYLVKEFRKHKGIKLSTTKILVVKI
ncbi:hypothetical protein D8B46_00585 [Candidatus Gracilibacteria bacterium]|nr:MAG: hypothetical protein D8B46_00585 [Candidatus Gracilibacteria bacterium]